MFTTCCEIFTNVKFSEKIKADFDEILFVTTFATTKKLSAMKRNHYLLIFPFLALFSSCFSCPKEQTLADFKVMTFNIRYDNPADSLDGWKNRVENVAQAMLYYDADVIGTQEVLHNQFVDLKQRIGDTYAVIGLGRDDGVAMGEYAALWYKRSRFELCDSGHFWLSQTPEDAGSIGWDAACVRIATWGVLRDKISGRELLALNTHFDHVGQTARDKSAELILCRADSISQGRPVIVTGDFNANPESSVVKQITDNDNPMHLYDTRKESAIKHGPEWTYHGFLKLPLKERQLIDYIFYRGPLVTQSYGVIAELDNYGRSLSDHCPVLVTMKWAEY